MSKLTPKQDKFARVYVETGNASEAYRQAYDVGENTKPEGIWVKGCEILKKGNVAVRVQELQAAAQERTMVTVESLSKEMDENRKRANELDQTSTMQSATMGKAKLHGFLVDKVQGDVSITIGRDDADL